MTRNDTMDTIIEKTEIFPSVLVIYPSGYTEFLETDVNPVPLNELGALIDAEELVSVHFSDALGQITKECGLTKNVVMYVDKDAMIKNLEDNPVATMLYNCDCEIRGSVIIALEDAEYITYAFDMEEDIESVFEAIDELTGLLRREMDDDGRFDAWA